MVNYRRYKLVCPSSVYFLTICTEERQLWFASDRNADKAVFAMNYVLHKYRSDMIAWVILPDHVHWLIQPNYADYSKIVFAFKRRITARIRNTNKYRSPACHPGSSVNYRQNKSGMPGTKTTTPIIWQGRFYEHTIRSEYELSNYFDYIHFNPVKHGYVNDPGDWKYSSFRKYRALGYYGDDLSEMGNIEIVGGEYD